MTKVQYDQVVEFGLCFELKNSFAGKPHMRGDFELKMHFLFYVIDSCMNSSHLNFT